MGQADALLNSLTASGSSTYLANRDTEEHIVIGEDRVIVVPESLRRLGVQHDHNIETVTFDCPRYWDEHDMSKMKVYINYMRKDRTMGCYPAESGIPDEYNESIMHFAWTISREVTQVAGALSFLVCIKKTDEDGIECNHWNSELCNTAYISDGLECMEIVQNEYPDLITHLLERMDVVEEIATPESMRAYIEEFLTTSPELREVVYDWLEMNPPTTPEEMQGYVNNYINEHPILIAVGPTQPGITCLWFDTSGDDSVTENTFIPLTTSDEMNTVYAEVEGESHDIYDYEIE